MLTEGYPNSMTAKYIYNGVGKPTRLEYKKEKDCATKCPEVWFSDGATPSIHGQWLGQVSTLSHQTYTYDAAGRLTEVQSTTEGKCATRLYSYDEDSNRVSQTAREPGTEGKCASSGGEGQGYIYDTADRLNEPGITYNPFGDITALPAQNAEDPELASTYYTDNQVASQTQNKQTISYTLDPAGRTLEANATGEPNKADIISHYSGPSSTPAWTENKGTKAWTRNITGINGSLTAIQNEGANPVLQLTNLHGDIIATASVSEAATALTSRADTSEFGVPTTTNPGKYAWLGSMGLPTELPSGVIAMGARSYVPQLGRFLQPDPVPGGSANAYNYTFGDPVNTFDPTGAYSNTISAATQIAVELEGDGLAAQGTGERQRAEREAAERYAAELAARAAAEAAAEAAAAAGPQYGEEWEEWEEWWEEESGYEYASHHKGAESGKQEGHLESGVLYQPLGETASGGEVGSGKKSAVPLCPVGTQAQGAGGQAQSEPCARDAFLGIHIHVAHIMHEVARWIIPTTDEIRERNSEQPRWMDSAEEDAADWGFDAIEWDWP
jgi:RHS repeat-associated protein